MLTPKSKVARFGHYLGDQSGVIGIFARLEPSASTAAKAALYCSELLTAEAVRFHGEYNGVLSSVPNNRKASGAAEPASISRNARNDGASPAICFAALVGNPGLIPQSSLMLDDFVQGRASETMLNGVSVARRKRLKPAEVTTSRMRASPDCAPRQSPTSCDRDEGVHSSVENE